MDTHPDTDSPAPALPARIADIPLGDRWTKRKMADFLRMLACTHNISAAARSVGMSRQSAYKLRARLKGQPFDLAWEAAFRHGYDNLAHVALERALNGVEVPHYHNGELVGTSRRYDERLTIALLAMRNRMGAPTMGRYGALAEFNSERWDSLLVRIETGSLLWDAEPENEQQVVDKLTDKHAPDPLPRSMRPDPERGAPDYRHPHRNGAW